MQMILIFIAAVAATAAATGTDIDSLAADRPTSLTACQLPSTHSSTRSSSSRSRRYSSIRTTRATHPPPTALVAKRKAHNVARAPHPFTVLYFNYNNGFK